MKPISKTIKTVTEIRQLKSEILGVGGSPRKNGNSDIVLKQLLRGADHENVECSILQLRELAFQGCLGCEKCRKDKICTGLVDGMSAVYGSIISSKGLVLVSPTHHYNITSWMKAFIDRLYCFYNFENPRPGPWSSQLAGQNRKAVVVAICEQETKKDMGFTLEAMKYPLEALGYDVIGELAIFRVFDKGKVRYADRILEKADKLGRDLAMALLKN